MSQTATIFNAQQFNEFVKNLKTDNAISVQQVLLPGKNTPQKSRLNITNPTSLQNSSVNTQNIPQQIQFVIPPDGFINNFNSNLNFNLEFTISNLPTTNDGTKFNFNFEFNNITWQCTNSAIKYDIVIYDDYICLRYSLQGQDVGDPTKTISCDYIKRLYQIPPSTQAYLQDTLVKKNNKHSSPFNLQYQDIYRKQLINGQLISQQFTEFMQQQYANVNYNQQVDLILANGTLNPGQLRVNNEHGQNVLSSYISIPSNVVSQIIYQYNISIPLAFISPLFTLSYTTPMELFNDQLLLIINLNEPIFSACVASSDNNLYPDVVYNNIQFKISALSDMKMILYKDDKKYYKTIEQAKSNHYYLIFRDSSRAQYRAFDKTDNIVLQNIVNRTNSLDMIQISFFDKNYYYCDPITGTIKSFPKLQHYLGYSSLFNTNGYQRTYSLQSPSTPQKNYGLNNNFNVIASQSDIDIKYVTLGDIQLQLDNGRNFVSYTYQTLEDIYRNNISLYDIQDNRQSPNGQWTYPNYLGYYNSYIYRLDNKYDTQSRLQQADFTGLTINDPKSTFICRLYNYNQKIPSQITSSEFYNSGVYNSPLLTTQWIQQPVFVETITYTSNLIEIDNGDIKNVDEGTIAKLIHNRYYKEQPKQENIKEIVEKIVLEKMPKPKEAETKPVEQKEQQQPIQKPITKEEENVEITM